MTVEQINYEMECPPDIPTEAIDNAVASIMDRLRYTGARGMAGEVFSLRAIVGQALQASVPRSNARAALLNALEGLEATLAEAEADRTPPWIEPGVVRIYTDSIRELLVS